MMQQYYMVQLLGEWTVTKRKLSKKTQKVGTFSKSCDFRPPQLRNDYRSTKIHCQMIPLRDVVSILPSNQFKVIPLASTVHTGNLP